MSVTSAPYQYVPVSLERHQTRVLTLCPGKHKDGIRIYLGMADLSQSEVVEYEALSYAWGCPDRTHTITVVAYDGQAESSLGITKSLYTALRYLRLKNKPRVLWIDAISINQENLAERNHQVQWMDEVYRKARRVVIFLGMASSKDKNAMNIIASIGESIEVTGSAFPYHFTLQQRARSGSGRTFHQHSPLVSQSDAGDGVLNLDLRFESLAAIIDLLRRPWFFRLWVVQEVRLMSDPNEGILQCGASVISWGSFRKVALLLGGSRSPSVEHSDLIARYLDHLFNLGVMLCNTRKEISMSMQLFIHSRKCSDPRDRLYGLLSLVRNELEYTVSVDYARSAENIFEEFQRHQINARGLWMLEYCNLDDNWNAPSWVPNQLSFPIHCRQIFATPTLRFLHSSDFIDDRSLVVHGRGFGVVQTVLNSRGMALEMEWSSENGATKMFDWLQNVAFDLDDQKVSITDSARCGQVVSRVLQIVDLLTNFGHEIPDESNMLSRGSFEAMLQQLFSSQNPWEEEFVGPGQSGWNPELLMRIAHAMLRQPFNSRNSPTIFRLDTDEIGYGPAGARPGDIVCSILGLRVDLVLRPIGQGKHKVVGPVSVTGNARGEAVLGPLPRQIFFVNRGPDMWTFQDAQTREAVHDPRLERLGLGGLVEGLADTVFRSGDIKLSVEELNRRGLQSERFILV